MAEVQQVIGKTLGSYRVVEVLGEGGMGVVYTAQHPLIGRRAAIKVLLPELSQNQEVVERFFNEARAATMIKHAGIIDIIDFGYADDNSAYIIMEYLDGESLTDRIERNVRLSEMDVFRFTRQAASALAAAHRAGIVHRDLKPDNIFVVPDTEVAGGERIKILDFGIAKLSPDAAGGLSKTRTGAVMGSPLYMSPEQCRGAGDADARADIYAMGCVMYHMTVGQPPFDGRGAGEVIAKHIYEEPTPPRAIIGTLSEHMNSIILQCMAKKPEHRFDSMRSLMKAIDVATGGQFATRSHVPNYQTPPVGVPVVSADKLAPTMPPSAGHPSAQMPVAGGAYARPGSQYPGADSQYPSPDSQYPRPGTPPPQYPVQTKSTTISGAAAQVTMDGLDRPPKSKAPLFVVLGVVAAAGIGVALAFGLSGDDDKASASNEATTEQPEAGDPQGGTTEPDQPEEGATETDPGETPPPEPEKVKLEIISKPSKALVRDGDERLLGETPFSIEVEKSTEPRVFLVSHFGYEATKVELVPDQDRKQDLELQRPAAVATKDESAKKKKRHKKKEPTRVVTVKKDPPKDPDPTKKKKKKKKKTGFGQTVDPLGD